MAKHAKSKVSRGKGGGGGNRPAPYPKKPTVEVSYEGDGGGARSASATKSTKLNKTSAPPSLAPSAPVPGPAPSSKAKGKARAAAELETVPGDGAVLTEETTEAAATTSVPTATFKIIAGSYEKLLYGLEGRYTGGESSKPTLEPIFIFPAHLACVKAIAASSGGKWLATGSEDEFVKVWDLRRRKEVGSLSQHTGSITSLTFPTPSHLLTTSVDATLSLFRTSDWALLKSLKGHSGRINHVDVHPTGRVALSVGKDCTLKMWDLMRGRGAASLALGSEAELVKFSPKGTHFAVLFPKKVEIYSLTLKLLHTLETKSRFNHVLFAVLPIEGSEPADNDDDEPGLDEVELLCIGTEKGQVEVYQVEIGQGDEEDEDEDDEDDEEKDETDTDAAGTQPKGPSAAIERIGTLIGHTNRIKAISSLPFVPYPGAQPTVLLTTVSSDGLINLYDLSHVGPDSDEDDTDQVEPVASYDTKGSRLTCVFLADGGVARPSKSSQTQTQTQAAKIFGVPAVEGKRAKFVDDEDDEEGDEGDEDEDEEGADMYDSEGEGDSDGDEGEMEVEFEDEDEEEEEDEGEYED